MKTTGAVAQAARRHFAHLSAQTHAYLDLEVSHDRDVDLSDAELASLLERRLVAWNAVPTEEQRLIRAFFGAEAQTNEAAGEGG